jgi:hypothetical protein
MSEKPYVQVARDKEAARRGTMPEISNRPQPSQSFGRGVPTGNEAAVSREVTDTNKSRRE